MYLRGLAIDNGGSEIRTLPVEEGSSICVMANDFITVKHFRLKETEYPLELCNIIVSPKEVYKGYIARGITAKMYDGESMLLNSQSTKTGSDHYYRQLLYAVARDAMEAQLIKEEEYSTPILGNIVESYKYVIVTCIPIKEHSGKVDCATEIKTAIAGTYEVEFPLLHPARRIKFEIQPENMGIVPEGGVAIAGLKNIAPDDINIVVDIGHVTTDLALFRGNSLLGSKVISSSFAGSTLIGLVKSSLKDDGFLLNDEQTMQVLNNEFVRQGAKTVDKKDLICAEKEAFIYNYIKPEVIQLLNMNSVNAKQVQNVIPIGASMNDTVILNALIRSCGFQDANIKLLSDDLRYVNAEQAGKFATKLYKKICEQWK